MSKGKKTQREILDFIKSFLNEKKFSPSIREIAEAVDLKSSSTVHGHLNRLREKGYITFTDSMPRTIQVLNKERC